ncbi:MAG: hypothetical protein M3P49_10195 [Actinomycetota bacterium]|nr:hypothetical protein [Actinomycetota bacterium]
MEEVARELYEDLGREILGLYRAAARAGTSGAAVQELYAEAGELLAKGEFAGAAGKGWRGLVLARRLRPGGRRG